MSDPDNVVPGGHERDRGDQYSMSGPLVTEANQSFGTGYAVPDMLSLHLDPSHDHDGTNPFCGTDLSSDRVKADLARIRADRRAGKYALVQRSRRIPDIGDRQTFNVSEDDSNGNRTWIQLEFELKDKTSLYHLWVEVAELDNGNVDQNDVSALKNVIHDSTPSRSINPGQGIFANNNDVFGMPPNVDGDGVVDILMYDIGRGSGSTLGYVSSADQLLNPPDGQGNARDILYLDSNEGTRNLSTLAVIAAHEYTHLIHLTYGWDATFITEGMAEYAMVMNGYYWRGVSFIGSVYEVSLPLFTWRSDQGSSGFRDYERGGLFFTYIGEQLGADVVGQMMKDTEKKGAAGMDSVLALHQNSLSDIILDYHTANYLNDQSVDSRFGYDEPERSSFHTFLTSPPVDGEATSNTGEGGYTFQFNENINAGSVHYLRISNVAQFSFTYDTPDPTGIFYPEKVLRNRARLLLQHSDGTFSTQDVEPGGSEIILDGKYNSVTFVLIHDNPEIAIGDRSSIYAGWTPLSMATDTDQAEVPEAFTLESVYPNPFSSRATVSLSVDRTEPVTIELVDMLGRHRLTLQDGLLPAGQHSLSFDASGLEPGTYLLRMRSGSLADTRTITLVR